MALAGVAASIEIALLCRLRRRVVLTPSLGDTLPPPLGVVLASVSHHHRPTGEPAVSLPSPGSYRCGQPLAFSPGAGGRTVVDPVSGAGMAGLLRTLGYPASVNADSTRLHARLNIAPNPAGLDLRALDGQVELALDNGTFTAVEPGAARVLGLVNLYVLPRRLRLDFRDVVDEGLAFDKVRANFTIENGNAYSDNVRIDTPSSQIRMNGRIGLAARDYDERITIMPKLGSSVAIASGVLGGPLVGAAVFAFQEVFNRYLLSWNSNIKSEYGRFNFFNYIHKVFNM